MLTTSLSWSFGVVSTLALVACAVTACTPTPRNFTGGGGSGGEGTGGTGGITTVCVADTQEACYAGPDGTLEVGICRAGVRVCLPDGSGFGECGGEVLPQPENCLTVEDEACNGASATQCPPLGNGWFKTFGSLGAAQAVFDVATTSTNDIIAVGAFSDVIDFGNGPIGSTGSSDIFVAKFDALGNVQWSRRFGDAATQAALAVTVDNTDSIYIGGSMIGMVDFGNNVTLTSSGLEDAFIAKLDPNGEIVWAHNYGDANRQVINDIEISNANLVVVTGEFSGSMQLAQNVTLNAMGGNDVFISRFDTLSGFHSASRAFSGPGNESVRGLAIDSQDRVFIAGTYDSEITNFGPLSIKTAGGRDAFVASMTPSLAPLWAVSFGNTTTGTTTQEAYDIAISNQDQMFVMGGFVDSIDLGSSKFFTPEPTSRSMFVAQVDTTAGAVTNSGSYGGMGVTVADGRIAIDNGSGQVVLVGRVTGQITFGGDLFEVPGQADPFLVKLDPSLTPIASRLLRNDPSVGDDINQFLALDLLSTGDLIVGGNLRAPILLDGLPVGASDNKLGDAALGRFIP